MNTAPDPFDPVFDYIDTMEDVRNRLHTAELKLAAELGILRGIRRELLRRSRHESLEDTPSVLEWRAAYTEFVRRNAEESGDGPPLQRDPALDKEGEKVASATFLFLSPDAHLRPNAWLGV